MHEPSVEQAIARIEALPTLPAVVTQIMATLSDPDSSALDLGRIIASDQTLSATLLRLVNSAYYSYYREIDSITQAIVILGFNEVRNLALSATAFSALGSSGSEFNREKLWRHALATGIAAERLVRVSAQSAGGPHFIAGLLSDIGKVVLDYLYPDMFSGAVTRAHQEKKLLRDVEMDIFGFTNAEAGGYLASHWNMPDTIVEAIRFHHEPGQCAHDPRCCRVVLAADYIAYEAGMWDETDGCLPEPPHEEAIKAGLTEDHMRQVASGLHDATPRIEALLGVLR